MIKANFSRDDDALKVTLSVEGHAGHSIPGKDIVCASASILAYTVAQIVIAMEHHGDLEGKPIIDLNEGDATIMCRCRDPKDFGELVHTFFVAHVGYALLAHNYPEYVSLESVW